MPAVEKSLSYVLSALLGGIGGASLFALVGSLVQALRGCLDAEHNLFVTGLGWLLACSGLGVLMGLAGRAWRRAEPGPRSSSRQP
jgi:hypothetical protein